MVDNQHKRGVGVFLNHQKQEAEQAFSELKEAGFPMEKVSIIGKDADQNAQLSGAHVSDRVGNQDVNAASGVAADIATTSAWGSVLVGLGSLAIPGIGAVIAAGSVGGALVASVAGMGIEAANIGGVVRALTDLGIPEADAKIYSDRLYGGNYLVIVDGTEDEISRVEGPLSQRGMQDWGVYNASTNQAAPVTSD